MHSLNEVALSGTVFRVVVHKGELQDCGEDEAKGHEHEKVQGSRVRNFREIGASLQTQKGHRQNRGDSKRNSIRSRFSIQPERHPGQDYQQNTWPVDLNQKISHVALQVEAYDQHRVLVLNLR